MALGAVLVVGRQLDGAAQQRNLGEAAAPAAGAPGRALEIGCDPLIRCRGRLRPVPYPLTLIRAGENGFGQREVCTAALSVSGSVIDG